jgi:hypothetical protein
MGLGHVHEEKGARRMSVCSGFLLMDEFQSESLVTPTVPRQGCF